VLNRSAQARKPADDSGAGVDPTTAALLLNAAGLQPAMTGESSRRHDLPS
jgi:hypothetical protein